jgi:adenylate cyclase
MRVLRGFAFIDLCGFTAYTDAHGDAEAVLVLAQLRNAVRAEAENHGVRLTKWLGDGAMLTGVESREVVACALRVRETLSADAPLPLRGGIAEGPVIMFEGDDYIGAPVNVAARLCDRAAPGQLLVAGQALSELPPGARARPIGTLHLPGVSHPVEAAELLP